MFPIRHIPVTRRIKFGGETYAHYSLLGYGTGLKRQTTPTVRSTITDMISFWFRTEMEYGRGLLLHMGGAESGDELSIQVTCTVELLISV